MSEVLREARAFEEEHGAAIPPVARPAFHLSPRTGWMNDPNGFSFYNGQYHLFYQYYPYDSHWGPMHWGHAVSRDLLKWTYLPAAMAPDCPWDREGVFSGSALEMPDGRHLLMYTGVAEEIQPDGSRRHVQTQNVALGDGLDYRKYPENPVIDRKLLEAGESRFDFRDPRIWREADGTYRAVAANNKEGCGGQLLLFGSDDALHWRRLGVLAENRGRLGRMWECPDFFSLDGKQVLLVSAQDMLPRGLEYHNGNGVFCMVGRYENGVFIEERNHAVDYGIDFYAPQTLLTPDGRRVLIGWMQNWDTCIQRTAPTPWFGQMTLPRELWIQDGRLCQRPLRELEELREEELTFRGVEVKDGEIALPGVEGRQLELELEILPSSDAPLYNRFALRFAQNEDYHTTLSFRPHESTLKIDRKFSGSRRAIIHQRRTRVERPDGHLKLRVILDRFSAEIFVGHGEQVLSATLFTDLAAQGVAFFADGAAALNLRAWKLRTPE